MRRGEVYWVDFDPARGGEIQKRRPAVIVGNNAATRVQNRVQVVPLTSNTTVVRSWEALVHVGGAAGKPSPTRSAPWQKSDWARRLAHSARRISWPWSRRCACSLIYHNRSTSRCPR